jgi:hypothetical protein
LFTALWFAKSFGIQFTQIKGADKNGKIYDLLNEKQSTNYTSLVDMEKEKVKNILFMPRYFSYLQFVFLYLEIVLL